MTRFEQLFSKYPSFLSWCWWRLASYWAWRDGTRVSIILDAADAAEAGRWAKEWTTFGRVLRVSYERVPCLTEEDLQTMDLSPMVRALLLSLAQLSRMRNRRLHVLGPAEQWRRVYIMLGDNTDPLLHAFAGMALNRSKTHG